LEDFSVPLATQVLPGAKRPAVALRAIEGGRDHLLSVKQVAARLGVSTPIVYRLANCGELPHVRISNAIRVAPADLEAFVAARRKGRE
jgi:excisionase family DNA binding protein